MPRHSNLREVQSAAYAPAKKPSPAPLVLTLLLPLLLIPAVLPVVDLLLDPSPSPPAVDLPIAEADSTPDLTISAMADGMVSTPSLPAPIPHHELPSFLAGFPVESPRIHLEVAPSAEIGNLVPLLETLQSCELGGISLSTSPAAPTPAAPAAGGE